VSNNRSNLQGDARVKSMQQYKNIREINREEVRKEKEKSTKDSLNYVVSKKTVNDGNQPVYREINLLNTQSNNSLRIWVTSEGLVHFAIIGDSASDGQWEELFINKPSIGKKIFDLMSKFYED